MMFKKLAAGISTKKTKAKKPTELLSIRITPKNEQEIIQSFAVFVKQALDNPAQGERPSIKEAVNNLIVTMYGEDAVILFEQKDLINQIGLKVVGLLREDKKQKEIVKQIIADVIKMAPKNDEELQKNIEVVVNSYYKPIREFPESHEMILEVMTQVRNGFVASLKDMNPKIAVYSKDEIANKVERIFNRYLVSTMESKRASKLAVRVGLLTFGAYGFNSISSSFSNMKNILDIVKEGFFTNPQAFEKLLVFTPVFILGALALYVALLLHRSVKAFVRLSREAHPEIEIMSKEYTNNVNFKNMLQAITGADHTDEEKMRFLSMVKKYLVESINKYKTQIKQCNKELARSQKHQVVILDDFYNKVFVKMLDEKDKNKKITKKKIGNFVIERNNDLLHAQDLYKNYLQDALIPYKNKFSWESKAINVFEFVWDWILAKDKKIKALDDKETKPEEKK